MDLGVQEHGERDAGFAVDALGAASPFLLAVATTLISEQGFRSTPPPLGGSFALL